jgi:hypothetical protein
VEQADNPDGLDQRFLRDDVAGVGDQDVKGTEVTAEERYRIGAAKQSLAG